MKREDLIALFGDQYQEYASRTGKYLPTFGYLVRQRNKAQF